MSYLKESKNKNWEKPFINILNILLDYTSQYFSKLQTQQKSWEDMVAQLLQWYHEYQALERSDSFNLGCTSSESIPLLVVT